jgi:hypothetical protein
MKKAPVSLPAMAHTGGKYPVHSAHPAMLNHPHERARLQPAEAFFDPFPLLLADGS